MRCRLVLVIIALWPITGFASDLDPATFAAPELESYYRDVIEPPQGYARVYVLPNIKATLSGGTEYASDIYVGPDADHAVYAGHVEKGEFLSFDVEAGKSLYVKAKSFGEATFHFSGNSPLFIRPFRQFLSATRVTGWDDEESMQLVGNIDKDDFAYDRIEPFTGAQHIQGWHLSALSTAAQSFVTQKIGAKQAKPVAAAPAANANPGGDTRQSVKAIPTGTTANTAESDLVALKRFYNNGLITHDEYDAKRREVLRALQ